MNWIRKSKNTLYNMYFKIFGSDHKMFEPKIFKEKIKVVFVCFFQRKILNTLIKYF